MGDDSASSPDFACVYSMEPEMDICDGVSNNVNKDHVNGPKQRPGYSYVKEI